MTKEDLEQIRQLVREESEPLKRGQTRLEEGQEQLRNGVAQIKTNVGHLRTALAAVKAGLDDIQDKMATEATVMDQGAKIGRTTRNHERRIEALEEQAVSQTLIRINLLSIVSKLIYFAI